MERPLRVGDAIIVDEIGIEYGRYGDFLLKTSYQPIFRKSGDFLLPCAVEGLIAPFLEARLTTASELFGAVKPGDQVFLESLCRALHLRNYHNIGVPGLKLFFKFDPRINSNLDVTMREIEFMASRLDEIELDPKLLVCEITETEAHDHQTLARIAAAMRSHGVALAIDDFGIGHSTLDRLTLVKPDIVRVQGRWVTHLIAVPGAIRLLHSLVSGLQGMGAAVLIEGIETPEQLRAALDARADYVQGYLLGRPDLAGKVFNEAPRAIRSLVDPQSNVVRLFGDRAG